MYTDFLFYCSNTNCMLTSKMPTKCFGDSETYDVPSLTGNDGSNATYFPDDKVPINFISLVISS